MMKIVILAVMISAISSAKYPSNYEKCTFDDHDCYMKVASDIVLKSAAGIPELGLPGLDPLQIEKIGINQGGNGPVVMNFLFKKLDINGISSIKFKSIDGFKKDMDNGVIDLKYKMDLFQMIGPYTADGKILILPMKGEGNANITTHDIDCHIRAHTKKVEKDGKSYIQIDKLRADLKPARGSARFTNLFGGNKELSDQLENFIDAHFFDIYAEIKTSFEGSVGGVIKKVLNNMFMNIPYEEFFKS